MNSTGLRGVRDLWAQGVWPALRGFPAGRWPRNGWVRTHWPPGLWWNGRVWLWQQRLMAAALLPLRRSGWHSDPWQRPPPRHLRLLMTLLGALLGVRLAVTLCSLLTSP